MTAPPKVLALCRWYPPAVGGVETYLENLYQAMPSAEVTVLASGGAEAEAYDRAKTLRSGTRVLRTPGLLTPDKKRSLLEFYATGRKVSRRGSFDHIHCGHVALIPVAKRIWTSGQRIGAFAYGSEFTRGRWSAARVRAYNGVDDVFSISTVTTDGLLERGVERDRIRMVTPGVDTKRFRDAAARRAVGRERWGLRPSDIVLLSVGRLHPNAKHKGFDTSIETIARLRDVAPGVRLMIAGDGPDRSRLEELALRAGVSELVKFLGRVSDDELVDAYGAADVYLMASRQEETTGGFTTEGFGIVFIEAAAAGLPVVATNIGGARHAVADGLSGVLAKQGDAEGLAATLLPLLTDAAYRTKLGEAGRVRVADEFEWSVVGSSFEALLKSAR